MNVCLLGPVKVPYFLPAENLLTYISHSLGNVPTVIHSLMILMTIKEINTRLFKNIGWYSTMVCGFFFNLSS